MSRGSDAMAKSRGCICANFTHVCEYVEVFKNVTFTIGEHSGSNHIENIGSHLITEVKHR